MVESAEQRASTIVPSLLLGEYILKMLNDQDKRKDL
jgi:hypothetical protein